MDIAQLQEKFAPVVSKYWLPILLGMAGFVLLLYGLIGSVSHKNASGDILSEGASDVADTSRVAGANTKEAQITLDVEGAVIHPGVYGLKKDARIQDALIASGGMSERADREKVAKSLNLATKVIDGGKIYIPFVGDSSPAVGGTSTSQGPIDSSGMTDTSSGLVNINSASAEQLDTLPGVGPATAAKIINNRPYATTDELLSKKAVGSSVYSKIKDKISVN